MTLWPGWVSIASCEHANKNRGDFERVRQLNLCAKPMVMARETAYGVEC